MDPADPTDSTDSIGGSAGMAGNGGNGANDDHRPAGAAGATGGCGGRGGRGTEIRTCPWGEPTSRSTLTPLTVRRRVRGRTSTKLPSPPVATPPLDPPPVIVPLDPPLRLVRLDRPLLLSPPTEWVTCRGEPRRWRLNAAPSLGRARTTPVPAPAATAGGDAPPSMGATAGAGLADAPGRAAAVATRAGVSVGGTARTGGDGSNVGGPGLGATAGRALWGAGSRGSTSGSTAVVVMAAATLRLVLWLLASSTPVHGWPYVADGAGATAAADAAATAAAIASPALTGSRRTKGSWPAAPSLLARLEVL